MAIHMLFHRDCAICHGDPHVFPPRLRDPSWRSTCCYTETARSVMAIHMLFHRDCAICHGDPHVVPLRLHDPSWRSTCCSTETARPSWRSTCRSTETARSVMAIHMLFHRDCPIRHGDPHVVIPRLRVRHGNPHFFSQRLRDHLLHK